MDSDSSLSSSNLFSVASVNLLRSVAGGWIAGVRETAAELCSPRRGFLPVDPARGEPRVQGDSHRVRERGYRSKANTASAVFRAIVERECRRLRLSIVVENPGELPSRPVYVRGFLIRENSSNRQRGGREGWGSLNFEPILPRSGSENEDRNVRKNASEWGVNFDGVVSQRWWRCGPE